MIINKHNETNEGKDCFNFFTFYSLIYLAYLHRNTFGHFTISGVHPTVGPTIGPVDKYLALL